MLPSESASPTMDAAGQIDQRRGIAPSLIIGVGGTGHRILLETRKRLLDTYGKFDRIPVVRFLLIDTDTEDIPGFDDEVYLDKNDIVDGTVVNISSYSQHLDTYPRLRQWIPEGSKYETALDKDIVQGASQVRSRGRFSFFVHYPEIASKLLTASDHVRMGDTHDIAEKAGVVVDRDTLNIYVVGSVMGGTGSGLFLDVGYAIRDLLLRQEVQGKKMYSIGMFIIPPFRSAATVSDRMAANGYSSLLELNHWSSPGAVFTAKHEDDALEEYIGKNAPFHYCYLLDTFNDKGRTILPDTLVQMMGHYLFLDLTSDFSIAKNGIRDNLKTRLGGDQYGAPTNYLSFGLSSLAFPCDQLSRVCGNRLAKELTDYLKNPLGDRSSEHLEQEGNDLLLGAGFDKDNLYNALRGTGRGDEYDPSEQMRYEWQQEMRKAFEFPNATVSGELDKTFKRFIEQCRNKDSKQADVLLIREKDLGQYLAVVRRRLDTQLNRLESWLDRDIVEAKINHPEYRQESTKVILNGFKSRIEAFNSTLQSQLANVKKAQTPAHDRYVEAHNEIVQLERQRDPGFFSPLAKSKRRELIQKYVDNAHEFQSLQVAEFVLLCAMRFYRKFNEHIARLLGEVDRYHDQITAMEQAFNREYISWLRRTPAVNGQLIYDETGTSDVSVAANSLYNRILEESGGFGTIWERIALDEELKVMEVGIYKCMMSDSDRGKLQKAISNNCSRLFREPLQQVDVLDLFARVYSDEDRMESKVLELLQLSGPFFNVQSGGAIPGYQENPSQQRFQLIGFHNARDRNKSSSETLFASVLGRAAGLGTGKSLVSQRDRTQVLFLTELGGFPLRVMGSAGLQKYKGAYQREIDLQTGDAVHSRGDIPMNRWISLEPPSTDVLKRAWTNFLVLLAAGRISCEDVTRYIPGEGNRLFHSYSLRYKDGRQMDQQTEIALEVPPLQDLKVADTEVCPAEFRNGILQMCGTNDLSPFGKQIEDGAKLLKNHGKGALGRVLVDFYHQFPLDSLWGKHVNKVLGEYIDKELNGQVDPENHSPKKGQTSNEKEVPEDNSGQTETTPGALSELNHRKQEIEGDLVTLSSVLADPSKQHIHEAAHKRKQALEEELLDIEMKITSLIPGSTLRSADEELDQLLRSNRA